MLTIVRPAIGFDLPWARPLVQLTGNIKARFILNGVEQCPECPPCPECPEIPEPEPCPECPEIPAPPVLTRRISNVITDQLDRPCERTIRAYRRRDGLLLSETVSDPVTGAWSLQIDSEEAVLWALDADDAPVLRDLILRVGPA